MRYITKDEGYGKFHGHVYYHDKKVYRHQIIFREIEPTENSWKDTGEILGVEHVKEPLLYAGNLYSVCEKDLEENTKPFKDLTKAFKAAFKEYFPEELEYLGEDSWAECIITPYHNLIVRLKKVWAPVYLEDNKWKFVKANLARDLRDYLDKDIVYTKHGKYYLKKNKKWYLVKNEKDFPIIQEIDCPHFNFDPMIPVYVRI